MRASTPKRIFIPWIRQPALRLGILLGLMAIALIWVWLSMFQMPGRSYSGDIPALTLTELDLREALQAEVQTLANEIGVRNYRHPDNLEAAKQYLEQKFAQSGYPISEQTYSSGGKTYTNLWVEKKGTEKPDEIVVIGGHYDSALNTPGANDNGTGVAATLELARLFSQASPKRTLRFVAFTNEEPPFFWSDQMGSLVYAKAAKKKKEKIVAMLSLETMGFYSDAPHSQPYPFPLSLIYPDRGNFISFVGNLRSGYLVRDAIAAFRENAQIPSEGVALPAWVSGVGWSDQWSFWQQGYPGIMVTDTATYRYPYYHTENDTLDKINFDRLTHVVIGLSRAISQLANA